MKQLIIATLLSLFLIVQAQTVLAKDMEIVDIAPSQTSDTNLSFCITIQNRTAIPIALSTTNFSVRKNSQILPTVQISIFHGCQATATQAKSLEVANGNKKSFRVEIILAQSFVGSAEFRIGNLNSNLSETIASFQIPDQSVVWWDFSNGKFFGSSYMQFATLLSLAGFVLGLLLCSFTKVPLNHYLKDGFSWSPLQSVVTNITSSAGIFNFAAILGLFSSFSPVLLNSQQYTLLTLIFVSLALLAGVLLGLGTTKKENIPNADVFIVVWVYFLSIALLLAGAFGQLILLAFLLAEVQLVGWISGIMLILGEFVVFILGFGIAIYTYRKVDDEAGNAQPTPIPSNGLDPHFTRSLL